MQSVPLISLDDLVITVYCALDDALAESGVVARNGKLVSRPGGAPEVDDREILCLCILQELLGHESDNFYCHWLQAHPTMKALFPRQLSRQNFADRRVLLTPLLEKLCGAFCRLMGAAQPPFSSSILIPSMSAGQRARKSATNGWMGSRRSATAPARAAGIAACANI